MFLKIFNLKIKKRIYYFDMLYKIFNLSNLILLAKKREEQLVLIQFLDQILNLYYNMSDLRNSIFNSDLSNYQNIL